MAHHDIEKIKEVSVKVILDSIPETEAIYIFGSVAKGNFDANSDIDLAFISNDKVSKLERFQIQEDIAMRLSCDVDLLNLNEASEVMRFQVVSEGKRLYESNMQASEQYEDKVYYLYLDLCENRQSIIDNIQESGSIYG